MGGYGIRNVRTYTYIHTGTGQGALLITLHLHVTYWEWEDRPKKLAHIVVSPCAISSEFRIYVLIICIV